MYPVCAEYMAVVRDFRESGDYDRTPTLRSSIVIAKVTAEQGLEPMARQPRFVRMCLDVFEAKATVTGQSWARQRREEQRKTLVGLVEKYCG